MPDANKKLQLIAEILQIEDEWLLDELERFINDAKVRAMRQVSGNGSAATWSKDNVDEMNRMIEDGFM